MKKEKISGGTFFQLSAVPWIFVYLIIWYLIDWSVEKKVGFISEEHAAIESIDTYMKSVRTTLKFAGILSIIWWILACNKGKLRMIFERNTIVFGAVFIVIMALAVARGPAQIVILDNDGMKYDILSEWCVLGGFAFNLFLFSPKNVRHVVFFKGILGSSLMACLAAVLSGYCLLKGGW